MLGCQMHTYHSNTAFESVHRPSTRGPSGPAAGPPGSRPDAPPPHATLTFTREWVTGTAGNGGKVSLSLHPQCPPGSHGDRSGLHRRTGPGPVPCLSRAGPGPRNPGAEERTVRGDSGRTPRDVSRRRERRSHARDTAPRRGGPAPPTVTAETATGAGEEALRRNRGGIVERAGEPLSAPERQGGGPTPCHSQRIAHRGACGKAPGMAHNRSS